MTPVDDARGRTVDTPSERVIEQRIRNRVIEYLDLARSYDAQRDYEQRVPIANVPYEVINMWEDNFPRDPREHANVLDVFSSDEIAAIRRFHEVWNAAAGAVPENFPSLTEVQALPEWDHLRRAAESASEVFGRRGPMPEDCEVP
jgi:hypothetical protein